MQASFLSPKPTLSDTSPFPPDPRFWPQAPKTGEEE